METLPLEVFEGIARFHELRLLVLKVLLTSGGDQVVIPEGEAFTREREVLEAAVAQVTAYEAEHGPIDITEYIS